MLAVDTEFLNSLRPHNTGTTVI